MIICKCFIYFLLYPKYGTLFYFSADERNEESSDESLPSGDAGSELESETNER